MRLLLVITAALAAAITVWTAAGYFSATGQRIETSAELRKSQLTGLPITDAEIATHVSRIERQGRNWGIAAGLSSAIAIVSLIAVATARRPRYT